MPRLTTYALLALTTWLLGSAAILWMQDGQWATPSLLLIASELGATHWARAPESMVGMHRVFGAIPIWPVTLLAAGVASLFIEKTSA